MCKLQNVNLTHHGKISHKDTFNLMEIVEKRSSIRFGPICYLLLRVDSGNTKLTVLISRFLHRKLEMDENCNRGLAQIV